MEKQVITVYNTLKREKEIFRPVQEGKVAMYVCGPTTYNYIHLGNARPIVVFDTIRRYFEYSGYDVTYISNFTDVDDKIIRRAHEEGKTPKEISDFYIKAFFEDIEKLGVKHATAHPRVSEHMTEIIDFIDELVKEDFAYVMDNGDVYFSVRKFPDYGMLSGRDIDDLQSGARVDVNEDKNDPLDFALWKGAKEGEPFWEAPWGKGRPGWHIECSAMSKRYLGTTFDIHGGGQDLIFPHHENEIAQSCAISHEPMANYWMHNGFITINSEKMSKSAGNFFLLRDILEQFSPDVVRFYLLSVHYRSPLDFDDEKLEMASRGLERLRNAAHALKTAKTVEGESDADQKLYEQAQTLEKRFQEAMNDDFNTALGISTLFDFAKEINIYLRGENFGQKAVKEALDILERLTYVLGISLGDEEANDGLVDDLIELLITLRTEARANKDFAQADSIRDRLKEIGVILEDSKEGTSWKKNH